MSPIAANILFSICFVAGKSGGHLLPCITQAEQMMKKDTQLEAVLFSSGGELDEKIMAKHPTIKNIVPAQLDPLPIKQPWKMPIFAYKLTKYFYNSLYQLYTIKPQKIISYGGLVSIPVCLAGKILGIPFELYELNVEPGKTTSFLAHFTDHVNICFKETSKYFKNKICNLVPYPVRFTQQDLEYNKSDLLKKFNLQENKKTVLIVGGSQGSIFINEAIKSMLQKNKNLAKQIQIIHQTGAQDSNNYKQFYENENIPASVFTYNERLQDFYNLADVIICRAGAGTLFEIQFFQKRCIIIPLETDVNNHQVRNAYAMANMNPRQFSVILQSECETMLPIMLQKLFI